VSENLGNSKEEPCTGGGSDPKRKTRKPRSKRPLGRGLTVVSAAIAGGEEGKGEHPVGEERE